MNLLVFAHTPPPVHGQSVMVATLIEGLKDDPDWRILHVNARLSDDPADIGRWRIGKLGRLLRACAETWRLRRTHGPVVFYYVPAPGKRSALYRDFLVLLLCRPLSPRLILHWHASGLGAWLAESATGVERWLAQRLLGRASLSIVLAPELAADAEALRPKRLSVVANGIVDPGDPPRRHRREGAAPTEVLFLGLCSRAKGIFDALEAVALAHLDGHRFHLTVAGGFADADEEREFRQRADALGSGLVTYVGPVDGAKKSMLFAAADIFCFPTHYPHEGQPLVVIEAMAADLPIVTTRWRAIPGMLPPSQSWVVEPEQPPQLTAALIAARDAGPANGVMRAHYLAHFTVERHVSALKDALARVPFLETIEPNGGQARR